MITAFCPECGKKAKASIEKEKYVCKKCNIIFKLKNIFDYVK